MIFFNLILLNLLLVVHAQTTSYEDVLLSSLHSAQGKTIPLSKKQEVLTKGIEYLKEKLKTKYKLDDANLAKYLLEDTPKAQDFRKRLSMCEDPNNLKTCSLRNLYSEINSLASTMVLSGQMNQCKEHFDPQWLQDQPITQSILNAEAEFDPRCEGSSAKSRIVLFSKEKIKGKNSAWPLLYSGSTLADFVNTSEGIVTASKLNVERSFFGKRFPKYVEVKNLMTDSNYIRIMMQEEMKEAIYERAVINSLSTKYSTKASFGAASYKDLTNPESMLKEIGVACGHCSSKRKESIRLRILNVLTQKIPADARKREKHQDVIASKICNQLNEKGYFDRWKKKPELATRLLEPNEVFIYGDKKKVGTNPDGTFKFDSEVFKKNMRGVQIFKRLMRRVLVQPRIQLITIKFGQLKDETKVPEQMESQNLPLREKKVSYFSLIH